VWQHHLTCYLQLHICLHLTAAYLSSPDLKSVTRRRRAPHAAARDRAPARAPADAPDCLQGWLLFAAHARERGLAVHLSRLPHHFAVSRFSRRTVPASRNPATTRLFIEQNRGRATAATVLADPVRVVGYVEQARMAVGGASIVQLETGRLLVVYEKRPPKGGSYVVAETKLVRRARPGGVPASAFCEPASYTDIVTCHSARSTSACYKPWLCT
jgi:hypothetical protein